MESTEYLKQVFKIAKRMEYLSLAGFRSQFNNSEMRLIEEVALAKEAGERIISTQLAKSLGVTRSAVSQMVNKLEYKNVVKRIPDRIDHKIAYIELTDEAAAVYESERSVYCQSLETVVEKMGKDRFEQFIELADEFCDTVDIINQ
ncbi:MAG: MarR family transcriptional regulator [Christensenellaceae bacterium]